MALFGSLSTNQIDSIIMMSEVFLIVRWDHY